MTVHIGPYEFDHVSYDKDGDVLYLRRGPQKPAADTFGTTEGHAVRSLRPPSRRSVCSSRFASMASSAWSRWTRSSLKDRGCDIEGHVSSSSTCRCDDLP